MCTCATIEVVNKYRQEYQYQHVRAKKPNNLVNVARKSRVQITIVEGVAAEKIIVRIMLLAANKRKDPRSIWRSKIRRTIL
jgi:hypothetical protein